MNMHLFDEYDRDDKHAMLDWISCSWCFNMLVFTCF